MGRMGDYLIAMGAGIGTAGGFARATGEVLGWLNADDVLHPGALARAVDAYNRCVGSIDARLLALALLAPTRVR